MANWNIMHVFGYGESQMMSENKNGKANNSELPAIAPLISYLATQEQQGTTISMETLHALNMYKDQFVDFVPNSAGNEWQRFAMADIDTSYIENLATELAAVLP